MLAASLAMIGAVQVHAPEGCEIGPLTALEVGEGVAITATISEVSERRNFHGSVVLEANDQVFPVRAVSAERCGKVAEALALIAELALDRLPKIERPPPVAIGPIGPIAPIAPARTSVYALGIEPSWHFSLGVQGGGSFGRTPSIAPTVPAFVELLHDPWTLRATFLWSHRADAELRVTHLAARLEACPFHVVGGDFELDPCAGIEVGAIHGRSAEASTGLWLAPGALARGRWRFAHPFFAELELAASFPLLRPRFVLLPDETLWQAPIISVSAGLGLGVMLW